MARILRYLEETQSFSQIWKEMYSENNQRSQRPETKGDAGNCVQLMLPLEWGFGRRAQAVRNPGPNTQHRRDSGMASAISYLSLVGPTRDSTTGPNSMAVPPRSKGDRNRGT